MKTPTAEQLKHQMTFKQIIDTMLYFKSCNKSIDFIRNLIVWKLTGRAYNDCYNAKILSINNTIPSHLDWDIVKEYSKEIGLKDFFDNKQYYLSELDPKHIDIDTNINDDMVSKLYTKEEIERMKKL